MRRRSLVAPLLLIGVGALFLARNLYPDMPFAEYVARYWPVLLIAWGVLRIIEILAWSATSRPLPARGLSGGEWVMVVLVILVGASVHTVHGMTSWWPDRIQIGGMDMFGERFEYPLSGERPAGPAPHVVIRDFRGDAKISGTDAAMVRISGHKTIRSLDRKIADRANTDTPLEITGDGNNIEINLHQEKARGPQRPSATLEITVPKGASIEVHGRNGDLDIADVNGSVNISSDNAGVRLLNIGGEAHLDLRRSDLVHMEGVKGAVEIKGRGSDIELESISGPVSVNGAYNGTVQLKGLAKPLRFTGPQTELTLEAVPGQLRVALGDLNASGISGPTVLSARSKDVKITDFTGPLDLSIERGDLDLSTSKLPLGRIHARSRSGDIRLGLPDAAQFTLNATTGNGSVSA